MNNLVETVDELAPLAEGINKEMLKPDNSVFELVNVAAQRCKQLIKGSPPRIPTNIWTRKNTSIALAEARQGLVPFTTTADAYILSK